MMKTRILALLLALLMLCSCAVVFASCSDETDGNVKLSKEVVDVDITGYGVIYGDSLSGASYSTVFKQRMVEFSNTLKKVTGKAFHAQSQDRAKNKQAEPEILIGKTDRAESTQAYEELEGDGFTIRVINNKIVIAGTTNLLTLHALQYFTDKYLTGDGSSAVLSVNESVISDELESVVLADSVNGGIYTHIYPAGIKTDKACPDYSGLTGNYRDYEAEAVELISEKLKSITKIAAKKFPAKKDTEKFEKEVLIGIVDRPENAALLSTLGADEWIISLDGNKLQVTSWSIASLIQGGNTYVDLLTEATVTDADGTIKIVFPEGFCLKGIGNENWMMDFPKPEGEGIELYNTMDAADNSLQFVYTGSGVNATSYREYCDTLLDNGYTVLMENEIEDSLFTTFVNNEKKHSLYVAYNAFKHKDEFGAYDNYYSKTKTGDKDFYDFDACFRIVSSPVEHEYVTFPERKLLSKPTYTKVTDSAVSTMPLYNSAVGLMHIVTLEDGSFVVFDSGTVNQNGTEHQQLWNTLSSMHEKIWGQAPSASKPVRIAAWVVTHAHGDHYIAFEKMLEWLKNTSKGNQLKIDYLLGNYPSKAGAYHLGGVAYFDQGIIQNFQSDAASGFKFIKVHTGQKYYLANLEIEVLTTWDDLNPRMSYTDNDTNTVLRFALSNADAPNAEPVTQIWTGDANRWQSRWMCAMYGDYLKAEMVSVAHHGNLGCEIEFYDLVSPTAVWWPHNASAAWNYLRGNKDTQSRWCFEVDQHLIYNISTVQYLYTAGGWNNSQEMDGCFTMIWLRADGPDYDNPVDAMTWEPIAYNDCNVVKAPFPR
ncbi:MAG: hypothetical protein E7624_00775 [Ruminococcaceae bacterium]|nr:hypothetical protein [Oscillospiraceae bacterium]